VKKVKAWRMDVGIGIGVAVGAFLWLSGGEPFKISELLRLIAGPSLIAILAVYAHNKLKQVGPYDPEIIERNKRGTL
jgi:hypothetical protein